VYSQAIQKVLPVTKFISLNLQESSFRFMSKGLSQALHRVEHLFPLVDYQNIDMSNAYVERLYHENGMYYRLLHSFAGSMHMTIGDNDGRSTRDHDIQLKKIAKQIESIVKQTIEVPKVLELGCGKGYNIQYLAKRFPNVHFVGIDITESYVQESRSKTKTLKNVCIQRLDMDQVSFDSKTYDLVYDIETVCHTQDHRLLLAKIYETLKENGLFILYDNFRKGSLELNQVSEKKALKYIELAVGIPSGIILDDWLLIASQTGFATLINTDLSQNILAGLDRYHKMASCYFNMPSIAKLINKAIPEKLKLYSIGAYLMKYSMELGFQTYQEILLKKI